jgi:hypothetical protein
MPTLLSEFYKLVLQCIGILRSDDPRLFIGAVLAGLTIGGLLWWAAFGWGRLWNKKFSLSPLHHILAAFVLLFAFGYTISAVSLKYAVRTVESKVRLWQESANLDADLKNRLSARLYDEIVARGTEDISQIPDPRTLAPGESWSFTYQNHTETQAVIGDVYTKGALQHFERIHPLLAVILSPTVPPELIVEDIRAKSRNNPGEPYQLNDGTRLLVEQMFQQMSDQVWRVVVAARVALLVLFLVFLSIPITVIAISAYRDIRIHTPAKLLNI